MDGISVIIPTYNRKAELQNCLKRLTSINFTKAPFEIIVMDDGSTDGTFETVQQRFPQVKIFRQENGGPGAARNAGVERAQYSIIAFTDSDCLVHETWLDAIYQAFSAKPQVGIVGGRTIELSAGLLKLVHNPQGEVEALEEPYCSTNNMAVKKKAFLSVGGFDPYFSFACEDVDFCFRVQKQGYKLIPNTEMVIDHRHPGNFFGWLKKSYVYEPGLCDFMEKYPETKRFFPLYYLVFPLIAVRHAWKQAKRLNKPLRTVPLISIYTAFIFAGIMGKIKHLIKNNTYRPLLYIPNLHVIYDKIKK